MDIQDNNLYKKDFLPLFRDADMRGLLGEKAYLSYFQDAASEQIYYWGKGNDSLPENYGCAWMYSKYKVIVYERAGFGGSFHLEAWVDKIERARLYQSIRIFRGGRLLAEGRLLSCVVDLKEQRIRRISDIGFPEDHVVDNQISNPLFLKKSPLGEKTFVYDYPIRYTHLDKNRHLTNLRYIDVMENALSPEEHLKSPVKELQINFLSQGFYGDVLHVSRADTDGGVIVTAENDSGTRVAEGYLIL